MRQDAARTPQQLGALLRGHRRTHGLTQTAVGERAGLRQPSISSIEADPGPASLSRIFAVLSALDLELVVRPRETSRSRTDW